MIWPVWIACAALAAAVSWRHDPRPALAIMSGLLLMRLSPAIPEPWRLVACAGVWIGIGGFIVSQCRDALCGVLVVASGLCYLWARVGGYPIAFGSPPFVVSDVFGVFALIAAARGHHGFGRGWFLGRRSFRWGGRPAGRVACVEGAE